MVCKCNCGKDQALLWTGLEWTIDLFLSFSFTAHMKSVIEETYAEDSGVDVFGPLMLAALPH